MRTDQIPIHGVLSLVLTQGIDRVADFCNVAHNFSYYMAESVFAVRLVNLRSVTCYTDQNFKENAHFRALNLFTSEKKVEIKLQDVYQP